VIQPLKTADELLLDECFRETMKSSYGLWLAKFNDPPDAVPASAELEEAVSQPKTLEEVADGIAAGYLRYKRLHQMVVERVRKGA
jgi:hypothetical protein